MELRAPGDSRRFDARHWAASTIDGEALALTRRIASELAGTRGWNARIVIETGRALAVVLADHAPGDIIAWSQLPPALSKATREVSMTIQRRPHCSATNAVVPDPQVGSPVMVTAPLVRPRTRRIIYDRGLHLGQAERRR